MTASTLIVVPMKDPRLAKSRLEGALDQVERERLAQQLFARTLRLLHDLGAERDTPNFDLAVVTGNSEIAARARRDNVIVIIEPEGTDLSGAIAHAAKFAEQAGYNRICVLPADLATPDPRDIQTLLHLDLGAEGVALCPSRDFGTNALLVSPPNAIDFAFGPHSFYAHRDQAEKEGITPIVMPLESLRWDIDSSEDLTEFLNIVPGIIEEGDQ